MHVGLSIDANTGWCTQGARLLDNEAKPADVVRLKVMQRLKH